MEARIVAWVELFVTAGDYLSTLIFSWPYFRGPGENQAICLHTVNSSVLVQLTLFFSVTKTNH